MAINSKKIKLYLNKSKPLTDIVETAVKTIDPEKRFKSYQLIPPLKTSEKVMEIYVEYEQVKRHLEKLELMLGGYTITGRPTVSELEIALKLFGGKELMVEYDCVNETTISVTTPETPKYTRKQILSDKHFLTHMCSRKTNREVEFTSSKEKRVNDALWELKLTEYPPRFFAKQRMNGLNRYFQKTMEPNIVSGEWDIAAANYNLILRREIRLVTALQL